MKKDSLSILKTFTRKLYNCRYRVDATTLIHDLKDGAFGYTVEKGAEKVVNNDFVLASDFEKLLQSIRVIFKEPRLFLKKENVVMHSELASKFNSATLKDTYKDEKLWRIKEGQASPEYVHSYVFEDDATIYENRFVCYLIDEVLKAVSKKINELAVSVETVNRKIGKEGEKLLTISEYVDFMGEELPVLITDDSATVKTLRSLIKTKKWLYSLKSKPLYKDCQKAGKFNPLGLKPTNVLTKDPNYYNCYNFYINYLNKEPTLQNEQSMYLGYVTVNLLGALSSLGFLVSEETEKIGVTNSAVIRFNKIELTKQPFRVILTQEENAVMMTVNTQGSQAKYLFKVLCSEGVSQLQDYNGLKNYVNSIKNRNGVTKTFVVNNIEKIPEFSAVYVEPTLSNSVDDFVKTIKSCFLLGIGSSFMHSRYCPVCGSNLITHNGDDYSCNECGTLYNLFEYQENDMIWFKTLPNSYQYISANETKPEVDKKALESLDGEVVKKTFMQKLASSEETVQDYYNQLKHELLSYKKVKSRVSRLYDRFNLGRKSVAKLSLRGKTLALYLALNPSEFIGTKYRVKDLSKEKKNLDTPLMVKVKSSRGLKYALELINIAFNGVEKSNPTQIVDYVEREIPKELLKNGYLKKSFVGDLCQAGEEIQGYYSEIKNQIISYRKTSSRVSFHFDTFRKGRLVLARIGMKGKTLVLYLALNPSDYVNTKYHAKNVSGIKKYADTPTMVKVKSTRGLKYALELIDRVLEGADKKKSFESVKYYEPYKSDAKLFEKGLAKIVKFTNKSFFG